ncbi:flagellar motor switch protein FliG [Ruixingdingia sedimenti]|uniref:Flagellar motor switch protein FliG n=1 Tax=Ruixingdingia sedimenti TaxID=3073604 RepID=A0ABU1F4F0_9RHOB|nr:FliG C-terminal domain-containing protein [Xinfangfangia sp. LG-4]MDR5651324.1 FliG C-terminal domain-containing protein [Xinfangfangia sp. LG-4]
MAQELARIMPVRATPPVAGGPAPKPLSNREKAAVIVRLLLAEGAPLPLSALPEHMQAALTEQMGAMRIVDRTTLGAVVEEFLAELDSVGLAFPGGIEGALSVMDGHISATAASRLRRLAAASARADPWDRLVALPPERLLPVLTDESPEVGAVMLSKLPVGRAADLLARLPGDRARRLALAVSLTGNVDPDTVRRIGMALAGQLDAQPPRAFEVGPVERVGAILNVTPAATRDAVLEGLQADDAGFAAQVRKAIFTFVHVPARLAPRDVPRMVRAMDQPVLVTALAGAAGEEQLATADFILSNMSPRLAQALREEMEARGKVRERDAEAAMNTVIETIRGLEAAGEIALVLEDGE